MAEPKRILLIHRQPPIGSSYASEAIDVALMAVILGQTVSHLFLSDGVLQILKGCEPHLSEQWAMLLDLKPSDYFVEQRSLTERGLNQDSLLLPVVTLEKTDIQHTIAQHDCILSF